MYVVCTRLYRKSVSCCVKYVRMNHWKFSLGVYYLFSEERERIDIDSMRVKIEKIVLVQIVGRDGTGQDRTGHCGKLSCFCFLGIWGMLRPSFPQFIDVELVVKSLPFSRYSILFLIIHLVPSPAEPGET